MPEDSKSLPVDMYMALFNASPHAYLILRPDKVFSIIAVNDRYLSATGTNRSDMIDKGLFEVFPDNPDDNTASGASDLRSSLNRVLTEHCQDTMGVQKYDIPLRDGSGNYDVKYWSPVNSPVFNEDGEIILIIHHVKDVTDFILSREHVIRENAERLGKIEARAERMEAEVLHRAHEVKDANRALKKALEEIAQHEAERVYTEEALRQRDREITIKNRQLEEASQMKSEFLANMSHELRTPLNAIIGFSDVLKDGLAGDLTEQQHKYVGNIFSSGQHLLALINDILDLTKVEAGKMALELAPLDMATLFDNSLSIVREKAATHRITLQANIGTEIGVCLADMRKTKQIIYNLLSNAVKFTGDGGQVSLSASVVPRSSVSTLSGRNWPARIFPLPENDHTDFLQIRVDDTGIGISEEGLKQLFQPFTQVDSGLSRKFEGTGLGLVMVRQLSLLHGGTVAMESAAGQGSSFTVWLPLIPLSDRLPEPEQPQAGGLNNTPELAVALVVEDNDQAAELIRMQLQAEGMKVYRAASAEATLKFLEQSIPVHLITLDILLPDMDGWELLSRIKQIPVLAHVPVVIISIVADSKRGFSMGASAVLQKPISRLDLHNSLAELGMQPKQDRTITTLVVDDDPAAVELIANHMPATAYNVLRAYGGREAIELARAVRPDMIVLDLMMPEVTGFDVVEALKEHADTANIPVLIVTSRDVSSEERDMLNGHVTRIMNKAEFNHGRFMGEVRRAIAAKDRCS
jgi:signal transduction histidine kinase/CheY-like chemotaxis protein